MYLNPILKEFLMVASMAPSWKPEGDTDVPTQGASQDLSERVRVIIASRNRACNLITGDAATIFAAATQPSPANDDTSQLDSSSLHRISMESLAVVRKSCDNSSPRWIAQEIYNGLQDGTLAELIGEMTEELVQGGAPPHYINMGEFVLTRTVYAGTNSTRYRLETLDKGITFVEFTAHGAQSDLDF